MKQRQHQPGSQSKQHKLTKAVTHIRLGEINLGKLATLEGLARVYLMLCQQYVTLFCTDEQPDKFRAPYFSTTLSERWHRVAIQQAAGIANRGALTEHRRIRSTRTRLLSTLNSRMALILTLMRGNPNGTSGAFPRSSKPVSRPMSML